MAGRSARSQERAGRSREGRPGERRQDRGNEAQDDRREAAGTERDRSDRDSRRDRERQHPRDSRAQRQQEEEPVAGPSCRVQGPSQGATQSGQPQSAQTGQRSGRAREERYTTEEKEVLIDEYVHRADRLEGANLSGSDRQRLWREIMDAVNAVAPVRRSMDSVKHRFQDCKRDLKKKISKEREQASRTGGGPPISVSYNTWERALRDRIPEVAIVGIPGGLEAGVPTLQHSDSASEDSLRGEGRQLSSQIPVEITPATRPLATIPAAPRSLSLSPVIPASISPPAMPSPPPAAHSPQQEEDISTMEHRLIDQINMNFNTYRVQQEDFQNRILEGQNVMIGELRGIKEILSTTRELLQHITSPQPVQMPIVPPPQQEEMPASSPPQSPQPPSPGHSTRRTRQRPLPPPPKPAQRGKRKR